MPKTIITEDQQNRLADVLESAPDWARDLVMAQMQNCCSMFVSGCIAMNLINSNEQRPA